MLSIWDSAYRIFRHGGSSRSLGYTKPLSTSWLAKVASYSGPVACDVQYCWLCALVVSGTDFQSCSSVYLCLLPWECGLSSPTTKRQFWTYGSSLQHTWVPDLNGTGLCSAGVEWELGTQMRPCNEVSSSMCIPWPDTWDVYGSLDINGCPMNVVIVVEVIVEGPDFPTIWTGVLSLLGAWILKVAMLPPFKE